MKEICFYTLRTFSATGGIEKVCRVAGKALFEYGNEFDRAVGIESMHDEVAEAFGNKYFPAEIFSAWSGNKARAVMWMVARARKCDAVILSHVNLLPAAIAAKKINPALKVAMFAHGIEVWEKLGKTKQKMLQSCNRIWAVSNYTRDKIIELHKLDPGKVKVLNNPLDPFLARSGNRGTDIRRLFNFSSDCKVLFTLTRLNSGEQYKGYDQVIKAMALLKEQGVTLNYVIAGKHDEAEKEKVISLALSLNLQDKVHLAGFIKDNDLPGYFEMADAYVMPSREEGFGIVFIEALHYGSPVIAGNSDGSSDALLGGRLGKLVNPLSIEEIAAAIKEVVTTPSQDDERRKLVEKHFGYESYKSRFNEHLNELIKTH